LITLRLTLYLLRTYYQKHFLQNHFYQKHFLQKHFYQKHFYQKHFYQKHFLQKHFYQKHCIDVYFYQQPPYNPISMNQFSVDQKIFEQLSKTEVAYTLLFSG